MAIFEADRNIFTPSTLGALALSVVGGFVVVAASDLRPLYSAAMLVGLLGVSFFTIIGQRRIMLVVAWILLHPMSVEKVIQVGTPAFPDFFPPAMVISASDVALGLLALTLLAEGPRVWSWSKALTPFALYVLWGVLVYLFLGEGPRLHWPMSTTSRCSFTFLYWAMRFAHARSICLSWQQFLRRCPSSSASWDGH